jgi:hypothetical protein
MTKCCVDVYGVYLGGLEGDGAEPPPGATEVPEAPDDTRQVWANRAWSALPHERQTVLKSVVMQRLIDLNKMGIAQAAVWAQPDAFAKWFAPIILPSSATIPTL